MKKFTEFMRLPKSPLSVAFEHSWINLYRFVLGALGLPIGYLEFVPTFFGRITKLHFHRGKKGLGMYLKESQRCLLQFLAGTPESGRTGVKLEKGLPVLLPGKLRAKVQEGDIAAVRTALTLLGVARAIYHKGTAKIHTITSDTPVTLQEAWRYDAEIRTALDWLKVPSRLRPTDPADRPRSNRSGPNGHATLAAHWDALALRQSHLWGSFRGLSSAVGLRHLVPVVESLAQITESWVADRPSLLQTLSLKRLALGRIGSKDEACGKVRLFAISDYWTQAVCKPWHDHLMKVFKSWPTDGTWDQGRAADRVRQWTKTGRMLYCYDLSAATDRFPASFTVLVLGSLWGINTAAMWLELLTGREYWYNGTPLRYRAGQPMGTLSSWAAFALSHHVVVQIAARRAGWSRRFSDYVLLGDDIVIADTEVAREYQSLMTALHVDINLSKSIVGVGIAEFAKRHFLRGHEVTGLSGHLILTAVKHLSGMRILVDVALRRGWEISTESFTSACVLFLPMLEGTRAWRSVVVSVLGPGAPLAVRSALWGGLPTASYESLMGTLLGGEEEFPDSTAANSSREGLPSIDQDFRPIGWERQLEAEIYRLFEIRRIRKARETYDSWASMLSGSLDALLRGYILRGTETREVTKASLEPRDLRAARDLLSAGHPASTLPLLSAGSTEHSEMEIMDLSVQLGRGDRITPAVWGLAPSGDQALLSAAKADTQWGFDVIRCVATTLPLAREWREPGALEMIREGLLLETGEVLTGGS